MSAAAGKNNDDILFQSLGNLISHEKILVVGIELHSTTPKQATLRRTIIQRRIIVKYFFSFRTCTGPKNRVKIKSLLKQVKLRLTKGG